MRLLDTDILIDILRQYPPALAWFRSSPELLYAPGFAVMELVQGCRNKAELRRVQRLAALLPIVWPTDADCRRALADFTLYHLSHNLGLLDSLVAATAVGRGATLCTFNVKHFWVVPGLVTEQPYSRP